MRAVRVALQAATSDQFIGAVEAILSREVTAFASATDPDHGVVWEVFNLRPDGARGDGAGPSPFTASGNA